MSTVNRSDRTTARPPERLYSISGGSRPPPATQRQSSVSPSFYPPAPIKSYPQVLPARISNVNPNLAQRAIETQNRLSEQQAKKIANEATAQRFAQIRSGEISPNLIKGTGVRGTSTTTFTPEIRINPPTPKAPAFEPVGRRGLTVGEVSSRDEALRQRQEQAQQQREAKMISKAMAQPYPTLGLQSAQATSIFNPMPAKPTKQATTPTILERRIAERQPQPKSPTVFKDTGAGGRFFEGFTESAKSVVLPPEQVKPTALGDIFSTTGEQIRAGVTGTPATRRYEDILPEIQKRGVARLAGEVAFESAFFVGTGFGYGELLRGGLAGARVARGALAATRGAEAFTGGERIAQEVRPRSFGGQTKVSEGGLRGTARTGGENIFGGDIAKASRGDIAKSAFRNEDVQKFIRDLGGAGKQRPSGGTRPSGTGASTREFGGRGGQATLQVQREVGGLRSPDLFRIPKPQRGGFGADFDVLEPRGTRGRQARGTPQELEPPQPRPRTKQTQEFFEDIQPKGGRGKGGTIFEPIQIPKQGIIEIPTPIGGRGKGGTIVEPITRIGQGEIYTPRQGELFKFKFGYPQPTPTKQTPQIFERPVPTEDGGGGGRGFKFGFPFGGGGTGKAPSGRRGSRNIFRLYDVATEPFGKVEVGLGFFVETQLPQESIGAVFRSRGQRIPRLF